MNKPGQQTDLPQASTSDNRMDDFWNNLETNLNSVKPQSAPRDLDVGLGDVGRGIGAGALGLIGGMGELARSVDEYGQANKGKTAWGNVANALSLPNKAVAAVGDLAQSGADALTENMSADGKEALSRRLVSETDEGRLTVGDGFGDIDVWAMKMAQGVGSLLPTLATGGLAGAAGKLTIGRAITSSMIKRGATKEVAEAVSAKAVNHLATGAAMTTGMTGSVGSAGVATREAVMGMSFNDLTNSEIFRDSVTRINSDPQYQGLSPTERLNMAREETANVASQSTMSDGKVWAAAAAGAALGDAPLFKMLTGRMVGGGIGKGMAKGMLGEGVTEGLEEGTQTYARNEAMNQVAGTDIDPMKGVMSDALEGGAIGAGTGGVVGGLGGLRKGPQPATDDTSTDTQDDLTGEQTADPLVDPAADLAVDPAADPANPDNQNPLGPSNSRFDPIRDIPAYQRQGFVKGSHDFKGTPIIPKEGQWLGPEAGLDAVGGSAPQPSQPQPGTRPGLRNLGEWQEAEDIAPASEPAGYLPGATFEGEGREVGTELPYRDVIYGADGRPAQKRAADMAQRERELANQPAQIGKSDVIFAGGAPGDNQLNSAYTPPKLSRDQVDGSLDTQSTRDPRSEVARSIEGAGRDTDSVFGPLNSLRITKRGKPFATQKEAAAASRKGKETPVELNGGGFGVAEIAEVEQAKASQGAEQQAAPAAVTEPSNIIEPGSEVDIRGEKWLTKLDSMDVPQLTALHKAAGLKPRPNQSFADALKQLHPDDLDIAESAVAQQTAPTKSNQPSDLPANSVSAETVTAPAPAEASQPNALENLPKQGQNSPLTNQPRTNDDQPAQPRPTSPLSESRSEGPSNQPESSQVPATSAGATAAGLERAARAGDHGDNPGAVSTPVGQPNNDPALSGAVHTDQSGSEPVTAEVIHQSATAATRTKREFTDNAQVKVVIAKEVEEAQRKLASGESSHQSHVTFDVPGNGKFTVANNDKRLKEFASEIKRSIDAYSPVDRENAAWSRAQGGTTTSTRDGGNPQPSWVDKEDNGTEVAIRFLADAQSSDTSKEQHRADVENLISITARSNNLVFGLATQGGAPNPYIDTGRKLAGGLLSVVRNRKGDYLALSADTGFTAGSSFQKYSELKKLVDSKSKEDIERTIARTHADGKARSQAQLRKAYLDHYHLPDPQSEADNDAEPTKPKGKSAKATPDGDPIKWAEEAEAALANVPDTHPLKKKWAANVRNNLKSESDRAAVLEAIKSAADRADRYQEQYAEKPATTPERPQFSDNKLFTADKVAAARARLKEKMGRLSSGLDPEILLDGMIIAGAYIEAGVRDFRAYAKAMTEDFGGNIKPYLLSFWEGARNYPGLDTEGMTSVEESAKAHSAIQNEQAEQADATTTPDSATAAGPLTGKDGTPKWFGSQEKAAAHLDRNDLADQYQPTLVDGQWQLHPRQPGGNGDTVKVSNNQPEGTGNVESKQTTPDSGRGVEVNQSEGVSPTESRGQAGRGARGTDGDVRSERGRRSASRDESDGGRENNGGSVANAVSGNRAGSDGTGSGADRSNYRIQPGELTRVGSWRATAEQNVKIVELVKEITGANRKPTADELALLTKFTGWGASEIANGVFPNQYGRYKDDKWQALGERLKAALTDEEYAQARRTTQYAHYTSEPIIRSVYQALDRMGFNGGNVLEPGMGIGLFAGLMPDSVAANSNYTGIEYDTITGNIAKLLYPASNVIVGDYTQTNLPKDFFDAAIGNPPFGSIKIQNDPEYKKQGFLLHDYFFAKTIDRVKPGGLLAFVTSKGTMDKESDRARSYLAEQADLVGAVRLPQTAFKDNAGTEVVTDVLFLRKRKPGEQPAGESWAGLAQVDTAQGPAMVNEYFSAHPEMVLGTHAKTSSQYRADEYTVEPLPGDIGEQFAKAVENLPKDIYRPERGSNAERAAVQRRDYDPKVKKEGGIYVADDGTLMQVDDGQGIPLTFRANAQGKKFDLKPKEIEWLKGYAEVRDALKRSQYEQLNNGDWEAALKNLNKLYDRFVKTHGQMLAHTITEREQPDGTVVVTKRFANQSVMNIDAESALIFAIEEIKANGTVTKGPAMRGRTLNKPSVAKITSVQDAMFVSLNDLGSLDLEHVAKLAGKSQDEVISELGNEIYKDPSNGWTTADAYLSGDVRRKLKEAIYAARVNKEYLRNVAALELVQPRELAPTDITVRLGSAWVPPEDVNQFIAEVLDAPRVKVSYSPVVGQWHIEGEASRVSEWGVEKKNAAEILEAVLNNKQVTVKERIPGETRSVVVPDQTEKANALAGKMVEEFKRWIWADNDRAERLGGFYNEHYNNIAPRKFDGAHLTLPGVSSRFKLFDHQLRAIWRIIQNGDTHLAHAVGAGKTFTMIAAGMEERRLGLTKKPLYVVPNHMLAQFSKEFMELYPAASIMVADEHNFHTHNRRKFVAQAALNDPDAIVITHSAFGRIGMSKSYTERFLRKQLAEWLAVKEEVDNKDRITVKQIERRVEQLENKLMALTDSSKKDQLFDFEELGVDRLYIDEGHEFRKLEFPTNRDNIKGIDSSGSQRAMDLMMKVQCLQQKNPGRALVMASGTPVTNTMGELFTVQRFFQSGQLEEDGDSSFDAWANHYGEVVDGLEQNPAGGYESVSRFAKFINIPEMMNRVRSFMDILTSSQLGDLVQRPDVANGGRQVVVTPTPAGYKEYQEQLAQRIKVIKGRRGKVEKGDDIILKVISDGRFSAIDMRFVDPTLPSDPDSKLNRAIDDLLEVYHATADNEYSTDGKVDSLKGASLMLFTDIGLGEQSAASRGFDMKAWIQKRLIEGGVKPSHIAFMRDHKSHAKKERLFDDMRQGRKRILIGGKDMETGVNAQKRLAYLAHLDAPWFPASVEQREGRIIRQGNQNKSVIVRAFATKGSYDSTMWGMIARKARFIEQAMAGDASLRTMEDVSEASAFEMAAALASGDERYLKLAGLRSDVDRLNRLYSAHQDEQRRLRSDKVGTEGAIRFGKDKIAALDEAIAKRVPIKAGEFAGKVGGTTFDNREDFGLAIVERFNELANSYTATEEVIGHIGGFDIKYFGIEMRGGSFAAEASVATPVEADPLIVFPAASAPSPSGIATRAVNNIHKLDAEKEARQQKVAEQEENLRRIDKRIGRSFPEAAELAEKKEALNDLEMELAAESVAGEAEANPDNVSFSQQGMAQGSKPAKGMTRKSAELVIDQWLKPLKGAAGVTVKVHATQAELELALGLAPANRVVRRAAFDGGSNTLHIAADTISDAKRLREILRHEVLAHYGLAKMLGHDGYQDLLGKVMNAKNNPTMKEVWAWVEANYAGEPASVQAEEVIAHLAEMEPSAWQRGWDRVVGWVMKALRAAGLVKDQISPAEVRTLLAATVRNMGRGNGPFDGGPSGGKGKPRFSKTDGGTVKVDGKNRPTTNSKQEDANPYGGYSGSFVITEDEAVRLGYDIEDIYYSGTYDDLSSGIQRGHLGPHNNTFDGIFASKSERSASSHGDKVQRFVVKNQDAASGRDLDTDESRAYLEGELAGKNLSDEDFEAIYDAVVFDKEIAFDGNYGDLLSVVTGLDEPAEQSWEMQRLRGQAARANGYDVVEMDDEHGVSYLLVGDGVHRLAEPGETPPKGSIRFSQTNAAADAAMDKLNLGPKPDAIDKAKANLNKLRATEKSAIKRWLDRVTKKVNTEVLDALAPIKYAEDAAGITDAADSGYIAARMASGAASTMQATMLYGLPEWQDGVIQRKAGTGEKDALLGIFSDLGADLHNWLGWMAGHRAEILLAQGRENLLNAVDIAALKGLGQGKEAKFNEAKARWNRLNAATLDLAQEAGLFSKEARDQFESEWYIPFFRETEDGDVLAPYKSKGIANQNAGIKKLKGGEANTNDLLENIFTSTAKLIDASMKNMAAQKTVWNLADTGIIEVIPKPNLMDWRALKNGHNLIMVKMEGEDYMIKVEDPDLYRAMTFFDRQPFGAVVNVAAKAKRLLTAGVTASPEFMLRNFLRDSLSSWAISKDGFKPVIDSIKGVKKTLLMDGTTIDVMFSGASFMGGYVNGNDPEAMADTVRKALRRKGMTPEQIARYEKSLVRNMAQAKGVIANVWEKYNRYGEAFENANREAVYEAAIKAGKSHAQAAFESKDLMDFSMLGASRTMQMLVQVLPFFNARVQGLGKLSRELRDNPVAIAKRAGLITAASLALLLQNWDDERYEELPDWDKDANWHFFIGDAHWRIPKPFEIGVMFGTIPERMVRAMGDKDTGAQFGKAVARAVGDTFAMNPTPQIVKPLIESAFNYDTFRGAPIDGPQDLAVKAEARYNEQTSLLMRELGELSGLSPKKLEHLLIGYTGTMGSYVMATADGFIRASQPGESAAWRADEIPLVKAVYRGTGPAKSTQHMEEFYQMLKEVNELKRTADQYRKEGLKEKARELLDEQGTILKSRSSLSRTQQRVRVLRNKIELIQRDRTLSADDKRQRIDALLAKRNDLVYQAVNKNRGNWD